MSEALDEARLKARKLLNAARRGLVRVSAGKTPPPAVVMCIATQSLVAEIVEEDGDAGLVGICRAIAALSIAHGQSEELVQDVVAASLRRAFEDARAQGLAPVDEPPDQETMQ